MPQATSTRLAPSLLRWALNFRVKRLNDDSAWYIPFKPEGRFSHFSFEFTRLTTLRYGALWLLPCSPLISSRYADANQQTEWGGKMMRVACAAQEQAFMLDVDDSEFDPTLRSTHNQFRIVLSR